MTLICLLKLSLSFMQYSHDIQIERGTNIYIPYETVGADSAFRVRKNCKGYLVQLLYFYRQGTRTTEMS